MRERVREREKNTDASKSLSQTAIDGGKAIADISSEERFYNRSIRIRKDIMRWMIANIDEAFETLGEMEAQAANAAKCSMPCARRWLFQYSREGKPFRIEEGTDYYVLRARG